MSEREPPWGNWSSFDILEVLNTVVESQQLDLSRFERLTCWIEAKVELFNACTQTVVILNCRHKAKRAAIGALGEAFP